MNKTARFISTSLLTCLAWPLLSEPLHTSHQFSSSENLLVVATEAGNDAFGTIQEIITLLQGDPTVEWRKVNLEALRRHLLAMQDMTLNVDVLSQAAIENGFMAIVSPHSTRAKASLSSVFAAHPKMLAIESGFKMTVIEESDHFKITVTTPHSKDIERLQGLGYIGIMALGSHHQAHHLAIAKGIAVH